MCIRRVGRYWDNNQKGERSSANPREFDRLWEDGIALTCIENCGSIKSNWVVAPIGHDKGGQGQTRMRMGRPMFFATVALRLENGILRSRVIMMNSMVNPARRAAMVPRLPRPHQMLLGTMWRACESWLSHGASQGHAIHQNASL
jgi:hypothetical protein